MPPKPKASYLRCTVGFVLPDRTVVKAGQVVAADDRVVAAAPNCFEPMGDVIESATRAPNERRLLPRRNPESVVMSAAARRNTRRAGRKAIVETRVEAEPPAPDAVEAEDA
jgi:hypothetical protein